MSDTTTDEMMGALEGTVPARAEPTDSPSPGLTVAQLEAEARKLKNEESKFTAQAQAATAQARVEEAKLARMGSRGNQLTKLLGVSDRIRVYRLKADGTSSFINEFTPDEVRPHGNVKNFVIDLARTLGWPTGTYVVTHLDKNKSESEVDKISIEDFGRPSPITAGGTPFTGMDFAAAQEQARRVLLEDQKRMEEVTSKLRSEGNVALAAAMEAMQRSQAQAAQMNQMLISQLLQKASAPATIPPPPPPDTSAKDIMQMMMTMAERDRQSTLARLDDDRKRRDEERADERRREEVREKERIEREREREKERAEDRRREREIEVERMKAEKAEREKEREHQMKLAEMQGKADPTEPIRKTMEMLKLSQDLQPKDSTNWLDVLSSLGEKIPDAIEQIAAVIAAKNTPAVAGALPSATPQPQAQQGPPPLPAGFEPYAKEMREAETEADKVKAGLKAIAFIGQDRQWKRAVNKVFVHVAKSARLAEEGKAEASEKEKEAALSDVEGFLNYLIDLKHIGEDAASAVMKAMVDNWDTIVTTIKGGGAS